MELGKPRAESIAGRVRGTLFSRKAVSFGIMPWGDGGYCLAAVVSPRRGGPVQLHMTALIKDGAGAAGASGYRRGAPLTLVIPRDQLVVKALRLPAREPQQLARMMPFEVRQSVPWPDEVGAFGYSILSQDDEGYSSILLYVAKTSVLEQHLEALARKGLEPTRVEPSLISLSRIAGSGAEDERPAIYFSGGGHQEFIRFSAGKPVFSRGVRAGNNQSGNLRATLKLLERSVVGLEPPNRVYVAADLAVVQQLKQDLEGEVSVAPLSGWTTSQVSASCEYPLEHAPCIGAALAREGAEPESDLMPLRQARRQFITRFARGTAWTAGLFAWLVAMLFLAGQVATQREERRLELARAEIARLQQDNASLEADARRIRSLERESALVGLPLALVLDLYERTPQTVAISRFAYDSRGSLSIGGEAYSNRDVMNLVTELQASSYYRDVEPIHLMKAASDGEAITEFKLRCTLRMEMVQP